MKLIVKLLFVGICGIVVACGNPKQLQENIPQDVQYEIIKDQTLRNVKRSLDIRINKRVTKEVLRSIAIKLKNQDSKKYERTFIGYYLPHMKIDAGAWATTHFNPDLKINFILGLQPEKIDALRKLPTQAKPGTVRGVWLFEAGKASQRMLLFKENKKLFMENTYPGGEQLVLEVVPDKNENNKFTVIETEEASGYIFGDSYLLQKDGNLRLDLVEGEETAYYILDKLSMDSEF